MALEVFRDLNRRFPLSDYAKDARLKMHLLEDAMAGKEMEVGRFYLNRKAYSSAVNRFQGVVAQYQTTKHIEEALHRMVECYLAMGLQDQAKQAAAVLGHNYPASSWYTNSYALLGEGVTPQTIEKASDQEETWLDRLKNWDKGALKKKTEATK
jgi:outer membrane protein assembly factor BamD